MFNTLKSDDQVNAAKYRNSTLITKKKLCWYRIRLVSADPQNFQYRIGSEKNGIVVSLVMLSCLAVTLFFDEHGGIYAVSLFPSPIIHMKPFFAQVKKQVFFFFGIFITHSDAVLQNSVMETANVNLYSFVARLVEVIMSLHLSYICSPPIFGRQ